MTRRECETPGCENDAVPGKTMCRECEAWDVNEDLSK